MLNLKLAAGLAKISGKPIFRISAEPEMSAYVDITKLTDCLNELAGYLKKSNIVIEPLSMIYIQSRHKYNTDTVVFPARFKYANPQSQEIIKAIKSYLKGNTDYPGISYFNSIEIQGANVIELNLSLRPK